MRNTHKPRNKTHCKEARNLNTAPFHGLYLRFSHISLSLYGFRDHPRMPSDSGCYKISNRLGLKRAYYQKTSRIVIEIDKKSGNFDKTQNYLSSGSQNTQKRGYMKVHLSYHIKDMSYASIGDDTVWPFESTGPIVG